jgi:hypothetical protein
MYGDAHTQKQAYVGVKLFAYCSGTPATCLANAAQVKQKFYDFLSNYPITYYMPNARYAYDTQSVQFIPIKQYFSPAILKG